MSTPPVRIDVWEMRCRFNRGRYWQRIQTGELTAVYKRNKHPAPLSSGQPHCTRSQEVYYYDANNREVARVHQYLRPDGSLGGKGKPDPKRLWENGILYALLTPEPEEGNPSRFIVIRKRLHFVLMVIWGPIRCYFFGK